jgi:3-deoxy-manno-octulosonate cytidylyltransferase (CMP-KDO synthetase)
LAAAAQGPRKEASVADRSARAVGFIPARMGSTRFPGKPLAPIDGSPMLEHCYRGAAGSDLLDDVLIATCDQEIVTWAEGAGIGAVMTSDAHERATDRVVEAAESVDAEAIVLIQGDEPMVTPAMIDAALAPVLEGQAGCTNLIKRIDDEDDFLNPNTIKVVRDLEGRALYFSRGPLPSPAQAGFGAFDAWKQVCIFGFTRDYLFEFSRLAATPLEVAESIDMLRYLEHGRPVHLVETTEETHAVDVPEDILLVEQMLAARA